ncbi:hypothetical protein ACFKHW_28990 [Bradyrhizobium lupini]|uniref:AMP-binding enzyme n=1 Tax=Rhizobium lupini TaxID=136996 RepID=UPI00366D8CD5
MPDVELRVVGADGRVLPTGKIGVIYSRATSYHEFRYHNKVEKSREIEHDGFITSGDIGYIDASGYVFLCDRKQDVVVSGGVNIYPAEIEGALYKVPGVHDCAVFGIPDAEYGEAGMALVEPQPGAKLDVMDMRSTLKRSLADYKVPSHIEIHTCFPREDSGKIFKRRLGAVRLVRIEPHHWRASAASSWQGRCTARSSASSFWPITSALRRCFRRRSLGLVSWRTRALALGRSFGIHSAEHSVCEAAPDVSG